MAGLPRRAPRPRPAPGLAPSAWWPASHDVRPGLGWLRGWPGRALRQPSSNAQPARLAPRPASQTAQRGGGGTGYLFKPFFFLCPPPAPLSIGASPCSSIPPLSLEPLPHPYYLRSKRVPPDLLFHPRNFFIPQAFGVFFSIGGVFQDCFVPGESLARMATDPDYDDLEDLDDTPLSVLKGKNKVGASSSTTS